MIFIFILIFYLIRDYFNVKHLRQAEDQDHLRRTGKNRDLSLSLPSPPPPPFSFHPLPPGHGFAAGGVAVDVPEARVPVSETPQCGNGGAPGGDAGWGSLRFTRKWLDLLRASQFQTSDARRPRPRREGRVSVISIPNDLWLYAEKMMLWRTLVNRLKYVSWMCGKVKYMREALLVIPQK